MSLHVFSDRLVQWIRVILGTAALFYRGPWFWYRSKEYKGFHILNWYDLDVLAHVIFRMTLEHVYTCPVQKVPRDHYLSMIEARIEQITQFWLGNTAHVDHIHKSIPDPLGATAKQMIAHMV
jgi:hypothetical protein